MKRTPLRAAMVAATLILAACASNRSGASDAPSVSTAAGPTSTVVQTQPVTVTGTTLPAFTGASDDAAIGMVAPALVGSSFDGKAVAIQPDGKAKMIFFVAHWCPHCQREVPIVTKWIADGKAPKDVEIFAVATGTQKDAPNYPPSAWLAKVGWPEPVMADSKDQAAAAAYGLKSYPYFVLVKADGTVAARASSELPPAELDSLAATVK